MNITRRKGEIPQRNVVKLLEASVAFQFFYCEGSDCLTSVKYL